LANQTINNGVNTMAIANFPICWQLRVSAASQAARKPIALAGLCVAILHLAMSQPATAATQFSYRWQVGQELRYRLTSKTEISSDAGTQIVTYKLRQDIDVTLQVKAVDQQGVATIDHLIERIRLKVELPFPASKTIEYDSKQAASQQPGSQSQFSLLDALAGQIVTMRFDAQGNSSDIKLPAAVQKILAQEKSTLPMSSDDFLQNLLQLMVPLSKKPVAVGGIWNTTRTSKMPLGTLKVQQQLQYQGQTADQLEQIDITPQLQLDFNKETQLELIPDSQAGSGKILFDSVAGRLIQSDLHFSFTVGSGTGARQQLQKISGDTRVQSLPLPESR
jgi:hypothetical protein